MKAYKLSTPSFARLGDAVLSRWAKEAQAHREKPLAERIAKARWVGEDDARALEKFHPASFGGYGAEFDAYKAGWEGAQ